MKNPISGCLLKYMGFVLSFPLGLTAAELNATVSAPVPTALPPVVVSANASNASRLPYGATEVVKLTRAQVSEDVIISYVQNSGSTYALNSDDIVRLRNEGVSDRVINSILDKHNRVMQAVPGNSVQAPVYADTAPGAISGNAPQQPVEAPLTPSGSSTYVIPYPAASSAYYGYYAPYYSSYYAPYYGFYGVPALSFRFGFGGHGGFRGGFHGGHGGFHGGHGHR